MDTFVENRQRVQPNHANTFGTVHGGNVMKWMDEVGAMSAMRFAGRTCLTANVDQFNFERPVPIGDILLVESFVFEAGRTSVKVRLKAFREDPHTGEREQTTSSFFVFVAVDEAGQPQPVPELTVESERGKALQADALDARRVD